MASDTPMADESVSPETQAKPAVSILVVAYNSADLIAACLSSISPACARHTCEVLLVDNGDGTTEAMVRRDFPQVRIVPTKGNVGFAAGNNWLASHASSNRFLLLNPDMELEPGAIDALLDGAAAHPDAAAWGGVTVDADGHPDSGNAIAMPSMAEFASAALGRSIVGNSKYRGVESDAEVDVLIGGFVMFDRAAWERSTASTKDTSSIARRSISTTGLTGWDIASGV